MVMKPFLNGFGGMVTVMTVDTFNNFLYISVGGGGGGLFRWDGFEMVRLTGFPTNDFAPTSRALIVYNGELYGGGGGGCCGTNAAGDTLRWVARWNGSKWNPLGWGVNSSVVALGIYKDTLYVGGYFTTVNSPVDSAYYAAKWHSPLDTVNCYYLQAVIHANSDTLYTLDSTIVQFYNNISSADSWQWDFGDSEVDSVQNPLHTYDSAGTYNIMVIVSHNNCTDTAYYTITIIDNVGINQITNSNEQITIYPNPTNGKFRVTSSKFGVESIEIYDLFGRLVLRSNEEQIDMSSYPAGMYVWQVGSQRGKLVLE